MRWGHLSFCLFATLSNRLLDCCIHDSLAFPTQASALPEGSVLQFLLQLPLQRPPSLPGLPFLLLLLLPLPLLFLPPFSALCQPEPKAEDASDEGPAAMPEGSKHSVLVPQLQLAGAARYEGIGRHAGGAQRAPAAGRDLIALALDGAERATKQLEVSGGVVVQHVVVAKVAEDVQLVDLHRQRVALLLEVLEGMLLDVATAGHVCAAQAGPNRLGGVAVHAVPLLRVEDGVVWGKAQPPHMLTPVHHTGPPAERGHLRPSTPDCGGAFACQAEVCTCFFQTSFILPR